MEESRLTVRQLMLSEPVAVPPACPLGDALEQMNARRIGAVVVVESGDRVVGIFTERDLLKRIALAPAGWRLLRVDEWMSRDPHTIGPDAFWEAAVEAMERLRVRHLPVVSGGRLVGLLSSRQLLRRRTEYLDEQVAQRTRELKLANEELLARDAEQRYNLRAAGRFQNRVLLPQAPPDWPELHWGVHYAPLDHLGGDYYDLATPDPDHLGILIADASGHSIAAAMVAIASRTAFREVAGTTRSPGAVLTEMNDRLQGLADERFVTAFYGVYNRRTRLLTYANAGHPYPLRWVAASATVEPLAATGFMLGIMPGEQYREKSVQLAPGDRLCLYTDGLVEARDELGETYGTDRLLECVKGHGSAPAERLCLQILKCQSDFRGSQPLSDDLTLVVTELMPP
jgi:serine phosphatase RsbU (regulator of sigma subunit)